MTATASFPDFWIWFKANEADFPSTTAFDAKYWEGLSTQLEAIQRGLVYEIAIPDEGQSDG